MTATQPKITPTQKRILAVLSDGEPHSREELIACLPDWDASVGEQDAYVRNLKHKIATIRKVIRPRGRDILCVLTGWKSGRSTKYQQVRLIRRRAALPIGNNEPDSV